MKDFVFLYRSDNSIAKGTKEQQEATTQRWMDWIKSITERNLLNDRGCRLADTGKIVKPGNVVTNGPYSEIKESIGGYSIIKANNYDAAVELAKECPIFLVGGNVEVREVVVI